MAAEAIAAHVPYLRRYARALTGRQSSADAYVAAALEALLADPTLLRDEQGPRVALFHLFTQLWNSLAVNRGLSSPDEAAPGPDQKLAGITPLPRQAFLLVALEGFSEPEAARILGVEVERLRELVEESGQELAAEIATDVLIIEDEALVAIELKDLVEALGHSVVGMARTHAEALALAKGKPPGLILADIQLADGSSGLEAVHDLLGKVEVPVIFITAYPERYLTGQRLEPTFLVAKPFQPARVSALISQALFFERTAKRRIVA